MVAPDHRPGADEDEDDRDHLREIQDILQSSEDAADDQIGSDVYETLRFDVCPECRKGFTDRWLRSWWICTGGIPAKWDLDWIRERYFTQHPEERSSEDVEA